MVQLRLLDWNRKAEEDKISEFPNWNNTTEIVLTENRCTLNLFSIIIYADLINTMQNTR